MEWIKCSDKLPTEKDGKVIISMPNGEVLTGQYSEYSKRWYKGDMMGVGGNDPIAWMPLPEPYMKRLRMGDRVKIVSSRASSLYDQNGNLIYELSEEEAKQYIGAVSTIYMIMGNCYILEDFQFIFRAEQLESIETEDAS